MLEIKNINKSYKTGDFKQKVLKNVSIKFRKMNSYQYLDIVEVIKQLYYK